MIFNLFKSKPTLKELIPEGFVDIHSHILPSIDDGAKDVNESLELLSQIEKLGYSKIIATPHIYPGLYENTRNSILKSYNLIKKNPTDKLKISYAAEYMIDNSLIKKAENKELLCLKENYVLIEMSFISAHINLKDIIFKLMINGYIPILAHPERYRFYFKNFENFRELKHIGCKFQINLLSTTGYYGKDITKITDKLLRENMCDFVGSDIHNENHVKQFSQKVIVSEIKKLNNVIRKNVIFKW